MERQWSLETGGGRAEHPIYGKGGLVILTDANKRRACEMDEPCASQQTRGGFRLGETPSPLTTFTTLFSLLRPSPNSHMYRF